MSLVPPAPSTSSGPSGPGSSRSRNPVDASPPARRAARPGWRDPRFAIGLVLVALSVVVGVRVVEGRDDTTPVLAAARPLVAGQRLSADDVAAVEVRFTAAGDADRYLPAGTSWADSGLEGSVLSRGVGAGELLPRAATSPSLAADVQVPLAVPLGRVPSTVEVGSTVDVWATSEPGTDTGSPSDTSATSAPGVGSAGAGVAEGVQRVLRGVPVLSVSRGQGLGPDSEIRVVVGVPDQRGAVAGVVRTVAQSGVLLVHRPEGS